jgi:hypothetical protein
MVDPNQLDLFSQSNVNESEKWINVDMEAPSFPDAFEAINSGVTSQAPKDESADKKYLKHAEWCYQFFDNEPVVFAYYKEPSDNNNKMPLQIVLEPVEGQGLTFSNKGMSFRLFAREISEATLAELNKEEKNAG